MPRVTVHDDERSSTLERGVHEIGPGVYAITADPSPHGRLGRLLHRLLRLLLQRCGLLHRGQRQFPLVHNYFAWKLKWLLLFRRGTAVTSVPYAVRD